MFARYVYYKEEDKKNQKETWISCSKCNRWVHLYCEQQYGHQHGGASFQFNLHSQNMQKCYVCPTCRGSASSTSPQELLDHHEPTLPHHDHSTPLSSSPPEHQVPTFMERMEE